MTDENVKSGSAQEQWLGDAPRVEDPIGPSDSGKTWESAEESQRALVGNAPHVEANGDMAEDADAAPPYGNIHVKHLGADGKPAKDTNH